jgi:RNA polymerase sigma-70 factor, ECF subfamily
MPAVDLEQNIRDHLDRGDLTAAATVAMRGYGPEVLGYLLALRDNPEDAREIFSAFSEDLWKGLGAFRGEASFRTWAYALAWHAACRFERQSYRKRVRRLATTESSKLVLEVESQTRVERQGLVTRLRQQMTPEERTLLVLRIDRALSWDDVARVMSQPDRPLTADAVKKRFERIKARLRRMAEEEEGGG